MAVAAGLVTREKLEAEIDAVLGRAQGPVSVGELARSLGINLGRCAEVVSGMVKETSIGGRFPGVYRDSSGRYSQTLDRPLQDVLGDFLPRDAGESSTSAPAESINGAGGPSEHRPGDSSHDGPPRPPAELATARPSPPKARRRPVPSVQEREVEQARRDDAAVAFVEKEGRARSLKIAEAAGIPTGSVTSYLHRLCEAGRLDAQNDGNVLWYTLPAGAEELPPISEPPVPPVAPPAAAAPEPGAEPPQAPKPGGGDSVPSPAKITEGLDGLVEHMLEQSEAWTTHEVCEYVAALRTFWRHFKDK